MRRAVLAVVLGVGLAVAAAMALPASGGHHTARAGMMPGYAAEITATSPMTLYLPFVTQNWRPRITETVEVAWTYDPIWDGASWTNWGRTENAALYDTANIQRFFGGCYAEAGWDEYKYIVWRSAIIFDRPTRGRLADIVSATLEVTMPPGGSTADVRVSVWTGAYPFRDEDWPRVEQLVVPFLVTRTYTYYPPLSLTVTTIPLPPAAVEALKTQDRPILFVQMAPERGQGEPDDLWPKASAQLWWCYKHCFQSDPTRPETSICYPPGKMILEW